MPFTPFHFGPALGFACMHEVFVEDRGKVGVITVRDILKASDLSSVDLSLLLPFLSISTEGLNSTSAASSG